MTKRLAKQAAKFAKFAMGLALTTLTLAFTLAFAQEATKEQQPNLNAPIDADSKSKLETPTAPALDASPAETNLIRFVGIVQFASGSVERVENSRTRSALTFQSPLYEGERLMMSKGAALKIVTASGCTGVIYGESQILTPHQEKPWRIKSQKLRWICPDNSTERLIARSAPVEVSNGEFFLSDTDLLVLRGNVSVGARATALLPEKLYRFADKQWQLAEPQPHPYEIWQFNEQEKAPVESHELSKPEKPITSRWIMTPIMGKATIAFDNEKLDQHSLETMGIRLQMHRRQGLGSLILGLSLRGIRDPSQSGWTNYTPEGVSLDSHLFNLEAGYRFNHERWWSPYIRLGAGVESPKITINRSTTTPMYFQSHQYEFYTASASAGVDAIYVPRAVDWLGLYASCEAGATLSLGRGARKNESESQAPQVSTRELEEPWSLTTQSLQFMLGGFLQF